MKQTEIEESLSHMEQKLSEKKGPLPDQELWLLEAIEKETTLSSNLNRIKKIKESHDDAVRHRDDPDDWEVEID